MIQNSAENLALEAFQRVAASVPAYATLLKEAQIELSQIRTVEDFARLPVLEKKNTFQRFPLEQLCVGGELGSLGAVLTSSGHSGIFAFGLTDTEALAGASEWIDDSLDALFGVKAKKTLLINCLPMGVKVPTRACTLAETSVRPDMAVGLVKAFGTHYAQIILVGEAAFIKSLLELGLSRGVDWKPLLVHVIVGEEPLAENARRYLEGLLGTDVHHPERGMVVSSMGVAELGLNLFSEAPPAGLLPILRRVLHENTALRREAFGRRDWVPSLFVYDPRRIYVEFDSTGRLLLTTLDPRVRVPLIRYATGDRGRFFTASAALKDALSSAGIPTEVFDWLPIVAIDGRGDHALAGSEAVYPEAVKEGIYAEAELASLTTANFRIVSGSPKARVRVQLSPGVAVSTLLDQRFHEAIAAYVKAPIEVVCERYEKFGSGMTLDYERKFQYLGP
jgi:phenylacetate-CoA ligase